MSETKIKTTLTLDKELYIRSKDAAALDARSFNSLVVKLLQDHIKSQGAK